MPETILSRLRAQRVLQRVIVAPELARLLDSFSLDGVAASRDGGEDGQVLLAASRAVGLLDLELVPRNGSRAYSADWRGPPAAPSAFTLAVCLQEGAFAPVFRLVTDANGRALRRGRVVTDGLSESVTEDTPGDIELLGANVWLIVQGSESSPAVLTFSPSRTGSGVVALQLSPPAVKLGSSPFGIAFPNGVVLDLAEDAVAPSGAGLARKGLSARDAKFYLPEGALTTGGPAIDVDVQIGTSPPGVLISAAKHIAATGSRPAMDVRVGCQDSTGTGLSSLMPTLVDLAVELPVEQSVAAGGESILFTAETPILARARYARRPGPDPYLQEFSFSVESQGPQGIASIEGSNPPGRLVVGAATVAAGVSAGAPARDAGSVLAAGAMVSNFIGGGRFNVRDASLASVGRDLPVGRLRFAVDYTVATHLLLPQVGPMSVAMSREQPLRLRVRDLLLGVNPAPDVRGLEALSLDFTKSNMEIEDPGRWIVDGNNLFDVLGSRSGRGSIWYEIDLGFRLDLGPIKVSGTTLRFALSPPQSPKMAGLGAAIDLSPLISGSGALKITSPSEISAALSVCIRPLQVYAAASLERAGRLVALELMADFPGPLPLASSGLGLFALGGAFCANGEPKIASPNSLEEQLSWIRKVPSDRFSERAGQNSYGLSTVIGTVPDLGFSFSSLAAVLITAPHFGIRAAMLSAFMAPRQTLSQTAPPGVVTGQGVLVMDEKAVFFGLALDLLMPPAGFTLMKAHVPVAAQFPRASDATSWYVHIGADGYALDEGRRIGPIRVELFPSVDLASADAYLMVRGAGIVDFPRVGESKKGAVVALGFAFNVTFGVKGVVWAEVYARAAFLLTMDPVTFRGRGEMGGCLGIGPFSIGIEAAVDFFYAQSAPPWVEAHVCGSIDLFFDELRACVQLTYNNQGSFEAPDPVCPLDHPRHALVDDAYRVLEGTSLATSAAAASTVWPDAIPLIVFATAPTLAVSDTNFDSQAVNLYPTGTVARPLGNEQLSYEWTLTAVRLIDDATNSVVPGTISCAWQSAKFADPSQQAQPAELALLTPDNDIWLHAVMDAGAGLNHKPLERTARLCESLPPSANAGWAVGHLAQRQGTAWRLPADPTSADPLQSTFYVDVHSMLGTFAGLQVEPVPLTRISVALLAAASYSARDARMVDVPTIDAHGRQFSRALEPPLISAPVAREHREVALRLQFSEELHDVEVWCYVRATPALPVALNSLAVVESFVKAEGGWEAKQPSDDRSLLVLLHGAAKGLRLNCSAGIEIAIIGVYGSTGIARDAAAKAKSAWDQQVARKKGPKVPIADKMTAGDVRCVLDPGRTYRLELSMTWVAKGVSPRYSQSPITRSFYFKTAPQAVHAVPLSERADFARLFKQVAEFDPAMIERYLDAYEPAHNTQTWFRNDPLRVHFRRGHVAALAGSYGFDLGCVVRALDDDQEVIPVEQKAAYPVTGEFMSQPQRLIAETILASSCGLKPPGMMWWSRFEGLAPLCWYSVQMVAMPPLAETGTLPRSVTRLPGVTFRTSRWTDPADMLRGLGFGGRVPGGDVEVVTLAAPRTIHGSDWAFEELLLAYGIDGWPSSREARVSHLWTDDGGWKYVGMFIESPEPIHRPGRLELLPAALSLLPGGHEFNIDARDRSGCRLLYATSTPFTPGAGSQLQLMLRDLGGIVADAIVTGRMELPSAPAFVYE